MSSYLQHRPFSGQFWSKSAQSGAISGQIRWPKLADMSPTFCQIRPNLADGGRSRGKSVRFRAKAGRGRIRLGQLRPSLAKLFSIRASFDRHRAKSGRTWSNMRPPKHDLAAEPSGRAPVRLRSSGGLGCALGVAQVALYRMSTMGRKRANFCRIRLTWANIGATCAEVGPISAKVGIDMAKFGQS